ncbi:hypothetical protein Pcinc_010112 [Petrolisthes cinctipes]|uniref:Acyl-coenzyme A oxidase n=1 Tax=Petrolisthes cinctipes TaxID=88211 RepID=A0AAE1G614_PETCI|nr:hypothetical protein Pcinc_010112 [Petrolisthes cinctipes]
MRVVVPECCEDLKRERGQCLFNKEELTNILDGGPEITEKRRSIEKVLMNTPELFDDVSPDYLSHEDRYSNELRKATQLMTTLEKNGFTYNDAVTTGTGLWLLMDGNPLSLHISMFLNTIKGQSSPQQLQKWLPLAEKFKIIGTYAQTELGHGTFVRGLETTATYDSTTKEFVLHSPTITATKWWPGALGKTSNHAVVMAQLYLGGKCYGPHIFMVQLRDLETHRTLPGIVVGEIGPRLGLNSNDNGFLQFNHHRIPLTNMFMKHSQVTEDGKYVKPLHSKLSYGTMVQTRVGIVYHASRELSRALIIAIRYSAVRHQSEMVPGEPEPQILDYQTQQYKLLPHLASFFALRFSARALLEVFITTSAGLGSGKMNMLPELHALSSGLKAVATNDTVNGIDICRLACGGHGYLSSSNLPRIYTTIAAGITYEGENTVMFLQVARYLIKSFRASSQGQTLPFSVSYLRVQPPSSHAPLMSDRGLVDALGAGVRWMVGEAERRLQQLVDSGHSPHAAWNACSVHLVQCAEAHTRYYICEQFVDAVNKLGETVSSGVHEVLRQLCRLYILHRVIQTAGILLRCGAVDGKALTSIEEEECHLLATLRIQAVSIVDAIDIKDVFLKSTLGAWDGNVYQRIYEEAQKSPLNKSDVTQGYYQYLRPLMKANL